MFNDREQLLSVLLANFCDAYLLLDQQWRIIDARGQLIETIRRPAEDLLGRSLWEALPDLQDGELHRQTVAAAKAATAAKISGPLLPGNGWVEALIQPGQQGVELYFRDIFAYRQDQKGWGDAEKSRVLFDALLENIPETILIADAKDASILVLSRYGEEILGIAREKLLHRPFQSLLDQVTFFEEDGITAIPYAEQPLIRAIERGDTAEDHGLVLLNARGQRIAVSSKYGPIRNEQGEIIAGILSWMDISERIAAERTLEETTRNLTSSNQALEMFAYSASHDLQEPLRKIISFSRILENRQEGNLDQDTREILERIRNASGRMEKMIASLLDFSRISSHPPEFQPVDLNRLFQGIFSDLGDRMLDAGVHFEVLELPVVEGDPLLLEQLFVNLVSNALKFRRKDVTPHIQVYPAGPDVGVGNRYVRVVVADNGIGFDMANAERIFQPFQRLVGRSAYEGNGLGLAISRKIAEQHGGRLTAQSRPGEGSRFIVELPGA